MLGRAVEFLKDESGYTVQALVWDIIAGLGGTAVAFAILGASRFQGGAGADDLRTIVTPSSLPGAQEQVTQVQAGYTGAVTAVTVE
ncbi:hypothetical protein V3F56_02915 [Moorellaceae bacterium AZ2]